MAKAKKTKQFEPVEQPKVTSEVKVSMSLEEARAYRASLHKPTPKVLTEAQKREAFRVWWAGHKKTYSKSKVMEKALWLHLKSTGMDSPEKFEEGIFHFGIKKS
jgi:hypothetical protein